MDRTGALVNGANRGRHWTGFPDAMLEFAEREITADQQRLLMYLARTANWERMTVQLTNRALRGCSVEIGIGERLVSYDELAKSTKLSEDQVRRGLKTLERLGVISRRRAAIRTATPTALGSATKTATPPTIVRIEKWREILWPSNEAATPRVTPSAGPSDPQTATDLPAVPRNKKNEHKRSPPPPASGAVERVLSHWLVVMEKPAGTDLRDRKRRRAVERHLKAGKSVEQLCSAVDGCKLDPFSMGRNKIGRPLDDITWICRDAENVEKFIRIAERAGVSCTAPPPNPAESERVLRELEEVERERGLPLETRTLPVLQVVKDPREVEREQVRRLREEIGERLTDVERRELDGAWMVANNGSHNWKPYIRKATEIRDRLAAEEQAPSRTA